MKVGTVRIWSRTALPAIFALCALAVVLSVSGLMLISWEEAQDAGKIKIVNRIEKLCNDNANYTPPKKGGQVCTVSRKSENTFACYLNDTSQLEGFSTEKAPANIKELTAGSLKSVDLNVDDATDLNVGNASKHWQVHRNWDWPVGQSWRPRLFKASTEVRVCGGSLSDSGVVTSSESEKFKNQRSPTLVGVISYRPDFDAEQRFFLGILAFLFSAGSVFFFAKFRQMQRESGLRHDLGNMLGKLDANVYAASQKMSATDLQKIADALKKIIENFRLAVASRRDFIGEPRPVVLRTMLESLLLPVFADDEPDIPERKEFSFAKNERQFSIPVTLECQPDDLTIECWPREMERVFMNLLINAAEAASASEPEGWVRIRARERFGKVSVTFANNGDSFDDEVLQNFGKTLLGLRIPTGSGGLGLTVVRRVVGQHRGRVRLRNLDGQGAEVKVTLPTRLWKRGSPKARFDAALEKFPKFLRRVM